ncbi:hypothetical protein LSM04_006170 [Trypanosoma melophagium]|uniref:uncharacterized protein n=1 Tax=Trypanosoma melophagium TaxID=715481 RepID=UPI00351A6E5B|nr:hypothetical protein LSM04_006170 [Trypanosoma melophagium]
MTILPKPISSTSFRSWKVIAGGLERQLCVQERTLDGLEKNKRFRHRLMYRVTDLARYRIIYSSNPLDYESEETKGKVGRRKDSNKTGRMVLAVADSLSNIMQEWEKIITVWEERSHMNGTLDDKEISATKTSLTGNIWNELLQCIATADTISPNITNEEKNETTEANLNLHSNGIQNKTENLESQLERTLQTQDVYDMFFIRIIGLWYGYRPIEAFVYLLMLTIGWFSGLLHWPLLCILTLCVGFQWRHEEMDSNENKQCMQTLCNLEKLLGWRNPQRVVLTLIMVVLLEYVINLCLHRCILRDIMEWIVPPVLSLSLLYTGIHRFPNKLTSFSDIDTVDIPLSKENVVSPLQSILKPPMKTMERIDETNSKPVLPPLNEREKALRDEIAPEGPFSNIVRRTIGFASESNGWIKREKRSDGLVIWEKLSNYSNKTAVLITANIPSANVGSLQELFLDDPEFEDKKTTYAYKYDALLSKRALVKQLGRNEFIVLTRYKSPGWGTAPREVLSCISCANLFTPSQQEELGIRSFNSEEENGKELMAFAQCGIDCPEDAIPLPPSLASREHQRAAAYIYLIMGLEEADGSLTLRLCFDVDPKGNIPGSLQYHANKQQIAKAEKIAKLLRGMGPKPNMLRTYVNSRDFFPLLERLPSAESSTPASKKEISNVESQSLTDSTTNPEVIRISKRFVEELLLRDWKLHSTKNGVSLWKTTTPWTDKKAVKTVTFIPYVTVKDLDAVLNNLSLATTLDKTVKEKRVVKTISREIQIFQTKFRSPMWGIAARDMVTRTVMSYYPSADECVAIGLTNDIRASQGSVFLHVAEDAAEELPISAGYTRGNVFLYGVLVEETVDEDGVEGVRLTRCAAADPGGSIPIAIVDAAAVLQIENTVNIAKTATKHRAVTS